MVSNRLNKFSIRKYTVGTASILVGTTLIFGIGREAKAAEVTNKEMKEDATSVNNDQVSKKVDTGQLNKDGNTSKVDTEQLNDENINKVANQKEVTRVENSVASEKIITLSHLKMENYKRRMLKTEDNNATSDDQVTTVNSQQLNTDNTTSNATMSAAPPM